MKANQSLINLLFLMFTLVAAPPARALERNHLLPRNEHFGVMLENPIYDLFVDKNKDGLWDIFDLVVARPLFSTEEHFNTYEPLLRKKLKEATEDPLLWMTQDFKFLRLANLPSDAKVAKRWGLADSTGVEWLKWFGKRVHVITAGDPSDVAFWDARFVEDEFKKIDSPHKEAIPVHSTPGAPMMNLTPGLVDISQKSGHAFRYRSPSFPVYVWGSQFGLLLVEPTYFVVGQVVIPDEKAPNFKQLSSVGNMYRISILLHEARHSDGNYFVDGGFLHGVCPQGHPYAGKECDVMFNGPYSVASDVLVQFYDACKMGKMPCSAGEIDVIEGLALASSGRVLDEDMYPTDAKGRKVVVSVNPEPMKIPGLPEVSLAKPKQ